MDGCVEEAVSTFNNGAFELSVDGVAAQQGARLLLANPAWQWQQARPRRAMLAAGARASRPRACPARPGGWTPLPLTLPGGGATSLPLSQRRLRQADEQTVARRAADC